MATGTISNYNSITGQLDREQGRSRIRSLSLSEALEIAEAIAESLDEADAPLGASITGILHPRYLEMQVEPGPAKGTAVRGTQREDGVEIEIIRGWEAFGDADWRVCAPEGYVARGARVNLPSGLAGGIDALRFEPRDRVEW